MSAAQAHVKTTNATLGRVIRLSRLGFHSLPPHGYVRLSDWGDGTLIERGVCHFAERSRRPHRVWWQAVPSLAPDIRRILDGQPEAFTAILIDDDGRVVARGRLR